MKQVTYKSQIAELKKLMTYQFFGICLAIIFGAVAYGLNTLNWLYAFKVGSAFLCAAVLGAPLVYSRAKSRIHLVNEMIIRAEDSKDVY